MPSKIHVYPLNRVEGDLKLGIEIKDNTVIDARSSGTMYRGFENILAGRGLLDGLVITPRICGICSTSHLKAAARALDMVCGVRVPDNGKRIRNITAMIEHIQNDVRQPPLLFMCDFVNPAYKNSPLYAEAVRRYLPLKGASALESIRESKKILEIIAILGGQWPHSSFMIPGGVVSVPVGHDIIQCRHLIEGFRKWYEKRFLGCGLERFLEIGSESDLEAWLDESDAHRNGEVGFFIRFSKLSGLDKIGKGHGNFLSYGGFDLPETTEAKGIAGDTRFVPSGFAENIGISPFDQEKISESVSCSWYRDNEGGGRHPFQGATEPYATGSEGQKYSWAKAPRYDGKPAETGPLAEAVIAKNPLFTDLVKRNGPSAFVRELARMARPAAMIPAVDTWLAEVSRDKRHFFNQYNQVDEGSGFGLIEAPRGALGHWITVRESAIRSYQIIPPSTWNASPKDGNGVRGPWEEAVVGTEIADPDNPVEIHHIIRSFDPCLVCTVHLADLKKEQV